MENTTANNATNNETNTNVSKNSPILKTFMLIFSTVILTLAIVFGSLYIFNTYIPKTQVQKTISTYYASMKDGNIDNLLKVYPKDVAAQAKLNYEQSPEMKKGSAEMLKLMNAKTTYKVKSIDVTGDTATAKITETTVDQQELQAKFQELATKSPIDIKQDDPQAQIKAAKYQLDILNAALKQVSKTKESDVDMKLLKEDKKWVISPGAQ
jgi:ribosomal protein L25 (general stress protein Ctc)